MPPSSASAGARFTAGESLRPFFLKLDRAGSVTSLRFDDGTQEWRSQAERRLGGSYLFYDPLDDWKGYVWVSREGVGRDVMERMIGRRFKEADFNPLPNFARRAGALKLGGQFPHRGASCAEIDGREASRGRSGFTSLMPASLGS